MQEKYSLENKAKQLNDTQSQAYRACLQNKISLTVKQIQWSWYADLQEALPLETELDWYNEEIDQHYCSSQDHAIPSIQEIQSQLDENQCVITYLAGTDRYSGLLINKHTMHHFDVGSSQSVDDNINSLLGILGDKTSNPQIAISHFADLLLPAEIFNETAPDIIMAPTHSMYQIPFGIVALYWQHLNIKTNDQDHKAIEYGHPKRDTLNRPWSYKRMTSIESTNETHNQIQTVSIIEASTQYPSNQCCKQKKQYCINFIDKGTRRKIQSLWAVTNEDVKLLEQYFYEHLSTSTSAEQALGNAISSIKTQTKYAHPYYWAGYLIA